MKPDRLIALLCLMMGCPSPKPHPNRSGAPRSANPSRPKTPSLVGGRATGIVRPSAWHGHTEVAREDGERADWRLSWTCDACLMVVRIDGAGLRRLAEVAVMQATD